MEAAMMNVTINERATPLHDRTTPIHDRTTPSYDRNSIKLEPANQDHPLDFSTKMKNMPNGEGDSLRKVSNDSAIGLSEPRGAIPNINSDSMPQTAPSIGGPKVTVPGINTLFPPTSVATSGMGMFYPGANMANLFPNNFMPPGFGPMWPNPMAAAAMLQQQELARKMFQTSSSIPGPKTLQSRPYKPPSVSNFPNLPRLPLNTPPLPPTGMLPNGMIPDPSILAEALKSHEEMFNMYKQQVLNQKAAEEVKKASRKSTNGNHSSTPARTSSLPPDVEQPGPSNADENSQPLVESITTTNGDHMETPHKTSVDNGYTTPQVSSSTSSDDGKQNTTTMSNQHSSEENVSTMSEDQRSVTSAHSSNGDPSELMGMRPRSSTMPTQKAGYSSPAPSHVTVTGISGTYSSPGTPNKGPFRKRARTLPEDQKDEAYWERRRKNNEAAKRSRDSRRAKEDEIAIRAAFLEQENLRLRVELAALRQQTAKLRSELIIYQSPDEEESARMPETDGR